MTLTYDDVPRTSMLGRLRAAWKIVAIFAIIGVAVLTTVRFVVFQSQSVVIEKVEVLCYAKRVKKRSLPFEGMTATDLTADCKAVKKFVDERRYHWRFVPGTYASFRYRSPADGTIHQGRIKRAEDDHGQTINVGDQITIYASRLGEESYTDFVSPTWP